MRQTLSVTRSGYYAWFKQEMPSARAVENQALSAEIKKIYFEYKSRYGSRRIRKLLTRMGYQVSRRRVCKLMKNQQLTCKAKRKFKQTTDSNHNLPISPNLLNRDFVTAAPNQIYVGDITYIPTQAGWLYLAVVIDLFSRQVVGSAMHERMKATLINDALTMAIKHRKPAKRSHFTY
jgi:putative transposase